MKESKMVSKGKSFSEALILASVNPRYDKRFFNELQEKYKFRTCCLQILFWMSKQKTIFVHVLKLYFSGNSMNNIWSYCGLPDARIRASEKDLPVYVYYVGESQNDFKR